MKRHGPEHSYRLLDHATADVGGSGPASEASMESRMNLSPKVDLEREVRPEAKNRGESLMREKRC